MKTTILLLSDVVATNLALYIPPATYALLRGGGILLGGLMKKNCYLFGLGIIFSLFAPLWTFSANYLVKIDDVFGRMGFSALYYTATSMKRECKYDKYIKMINNNESYADVQVSMMQDFVQKYNDGEKDFCLIMLDNMARGSLGHADRKHSQLVTIFKEELFGTQTTKNGSGEKKK